MTPEQLKASILQYAIQGKLVDQRPEEKKVDLSHIKLKKTEEFEFDIPDSWLTAHLESITKNVPSKQYQIAASDFKTTGKYPVVSQSKEYIIGYNDDASKLYRHENPVVIFGDHTTEVKYVDFDFIVGADGVKIFEPIETVIVGKFLKHILEFYSIGLEKVGGYSRHYKFIKDKAFPIPPLSEQKRIVAKIEELLAYVDRYAAAYEKLEQFNAKFPEDMKKSILQYAIQGKLVEQRAEEGTGEELYRQIQYEKQRLIKEGKIKKEKPLAEITEDEVPFDIPESWKWCRLSDVIDVRDGTHDSPKYVPVGIPLVTSKNLVNGVIDYSNIKYITQEDADKINARSLVDDDDILFAMIGSIGNPVLVKKDREFCIKNMALFKRFANTEISMRYAYWFLFYAQYKLKKEASGGVQSFISLSRFREYLIPLPPVAEQNRIVAKLEEILPLCERLK